MILIAFGLDYAHLPNLDMSVKRVRSAHFVLRHGFSRASLTRLRGSLRPETKKKITYYE